MSDPKPDRVVCDVETYRNYFLVALKNTRNGKVKTFEKHDGADLDRKGLIDLLRKYQIVTFNGNHYDMPMIALALAGRSCSELKDASDMIIRTDLRPWIFERQYGVTIPKIDHIDLMEVAPLKASLKIYNGRLHGPRMQDLPYDPDALLDADQREATKAYCVNDLDATALLLRACEEPIELREVMSADYGLDLRSKSDAQVAEAVVKAELEKLSGEKPARPSLPEGFSFRYQIPVWMRFETPALQGLLERIRTHDFTLDHNDRVVAPSFLKETPYQVGSAKYALGVGGMHSMEQSTAHVSDDEYLLIDRDVASYYPMIILNQRLFPKHIGEDFLTVYRKLVDRRLVAKREGKKLVADSLKISINGLFGKLGSAYSAVFAPDLMLQVTLSGQLCLLMLIERIEAAGIHVVSGNTDGFITKVPRARYDEFLGLVKAWEQITGFETEETRYRAVYSRDVNNYVAVKEDGKTKGKGAYANPWRGGKPDWRRQMSLTPSSSICVEAVEERLVHGTPVDVTIRGCRDLTKFVNVRTVKGGGLYADEYLGKAVRWYYGYSSEGPIVYKISGNKVAGSDGAVPCMDLPEHFPNDVNYDEYIRIADEMLADLGATERFKPPKVSKINKSHPYQLFLADVVSEIKRANRRRAR